MTNSFALNWILSTIITFVIFNLFGWGAVLTVWFIAWNTWEINWAVTWFIERAVFILSILFGLVAAEDGGF